MGLGVPTPELFGQRIGDLKSYFVLCFAICVLTIARGLQHHPLPRRPRLRRDPRQRDRRGGHGRDAVRYKTLAFALSAAITGLAGALYAHLFDRLNPQNFTLAMSIELLVMVVVGGLASVLG